MLFIIFLCRLTEYNKANSQQDLKALHTSPPTDLQRPVFTVDEAFPSGLQRSPRGKKKKPGLNPFAGLWWTSFSPTSSSRCIPETLKFSQQRALKKKKSCNLPTMTRQRISQALQDRVERGRKEGWRRRSGAISTRAVNVRAALPPARAVGD